MCQGLSLGLRYADREKIKKEWRNDMKYFDLAGNRASRVAQGCMRITSLNPQQLDALVKRDLELGINFFDHADIYGGGECERMFGEFLKENPSLRDEMLIQTKCAIRPDCYDFSKEHILTSVEGSLKRLNIETIDFLLLHRPDTLCEPQEVAEAFSVLREQGKVRNFGVSNANPYQIQLLNQYLNEKILINQLQFGLGHTTMVDAGLNVNMDNDPAVNRDGGILDFCRLNRITIQPWSPFQYGFFSGTFIGNPNFKELNSKLEEISEKYGITPTGLSIAWILRHPACMQPIVGSVNTERMKAVVDASDVTITRQEWYELYCATGKTLP